MDQANQLQTGDSTNGHSTTDDAGVYGQDDDIPYNNDSFPSLLAPFDKELTAFANAGIFVCLCGIAFNLVLVLLILGSKRLRGRHIYEQILNIAIADLGFVVTVDCFSVHNNLHSWTFGVAFCKAWIILDVALPAVSIMAIMLLNADRVMFLYKTSLYEKMVKRTMTRIFVLTYPWFISSILVCSLWLGFKKVEPKPALCMYGISKEANTASTWLTVFLPAIFIVFLVVFASIAAFADTPNEPTPLPHSRTQTRLRHAHNTRSANLSRIRREEFTLVQNSPESTGVATRISTTTTTTAAATNTATTQLSDPSEHRPMVVTILTVDLISLLLSLPFTAFAHLSPVCDSKASCQSMFTLFQTLTWMRSSVTCFRPLLFIFLTKARFVCVNEDEFCWCQTRGSSSSSSYSHTSSARLVDGSIPQDNTSSSQNNETQQTTSLIETQSQSTARSTTTIHIKDEVSTSVELNQRFSRPDSENERKLSFSLSIPCQVGGEKSSETFM